MASTIGSFIQKLEDEFAHRRVYVHEIREFRERQLKETQERHNSKGGKHSHNTQMAVILAILEKRFLYVDTITDDEILKAHTQILKKINKKKFDLDLVKQLCYSYQGRSNSTSAYLKR